MSEENISGHKKTERINPCEISPETDPVIEKLLKIGCLDQHYIVQDCYFETKDWRKCVKEVKEFQDCVNKAKKN